MLSSGGDYVYKLTGLAVGQWVCIDESNGTVNRNYLWNVGHVVLPAINQSPFRIQANRFRIIILTEHVDDVSDDVSDDVRDSTFRRG